jgi:hypothetical protein
VESGFPSESASKKRLEQFHVSIKHEIALEHDLFRPSFARRSGLREGGKPVPTPGSSPGAGFFGIMLERFHVEWNHESALSLCLVAFSAANRYPLRRKML